MGRKQEARKNFEGSDALFNSCWRQLLIIEHCNGYVDSIEDTLEQLASEKVNDCNSPYYMYG